MSDLGATFGISALLLLALAFGGLMLSPAIYKWERDAGYPYGKMCNSVFTGYVDTCRK